MAFDFLIALMRRSKRGYFDAITFAKRGSILVDKLQALELILIEMRQFDTPIE